MYARELRYSAFSTVLAALALAPGCDSATDIADGTAKASSAQPGWSVTYSGDQSGKISGKVSQITSVAAGLYVVASDLKGNSMTVGLAVAPADTGPVTAETFNITIDKEACEQEEGSPVKLDVTDGDKTSLAFTISGTLKCEGKRGVVEIDGTFRKK